MSDSAPKKIGRPKGAKTKSQKILADAQAIIEKNFGIIGFHPVTAMLVIAADERHDASLRLQAMSKAAPFVASTLKSVELTGEGGGPVQHADVTEMAAQAAKVFGISANDALSAVGGVVAAEDDDDEEEEIDEEREAIAAARRAEIAAEAEEAQAARDAAKKAASRPGRRDTSVGVDEEVFGPGSV